MLLSACSIGRHGGARLCGAAFWLVGMFLLAIHWASPGLAQSADPFELCEIPALAFEERKRRPRVLPRYALQPVGLKASASQTKPRALAADNKPCASPPGLWFAAAPLLPRTQPDAGRFEPAAAKRRAFHARGPPCRIA